MNYKEKLYHPKSDKLQVLSHIKLLGYQKFLKEIKKLKSHPAVKGYLERNLFPKKISDLDRNRKKYSSNNIGGELGWIIYSIIKNSEKINEYLKLKNQFEKQLLLGHYDNAFSILDRIETEISYSFWSIESKFSLKEEKLGTEKNWEFLNELNKEVEGNSLLSFYFEFFSRKAEKKLLFNRYKRSLIYDLSNLDEDLKEYLFYKFGYFLHNRYHHFDFFLLKECEFSLIDKYELLISILNDLIIDDSDSEYQTYVQILKDLNKQIEDSRIIRMLEFTGAIELNENKIPLAVDEYIRNYSLGNYDICISSFQNVVIEYPNCLELYILFVKSLIEKGLTFEKMNFSNEINEIIKCVFSLYLFNEEYDLSLENLNKKALAFSNLKFYKQILGLVSYFMKSDSKSSIRPHHLFLNSIFSNPALYIINIDKSFNLISESLMFRINHDISCNFYDLKSFVNVVPEKKNFLYEIRNLICNSHYQKCLEKIKIFSERSDLNSIDNSEIFNYKYLCYVQMNKFDSAVKLLANQLMNNKNFCSKIDIDLLFNKIVEADFKIVSPSYELVILCSHANASSYLLFVSLDELFLSLDIEYPHQLFDKIDKKNIDMILYILQVVCNIDVLGNFLIYDTRRQVVKERENILARLIELIPNKESDFISEIAKIKNSEIIQNVVKEVNDGRIYINIKSLDESKKQLLENSYQRILSLLEYTKSNDLYFLDTDGNIQRLYLDFSLNEEQIKKDASFLACKSFINEITNSFLYSKEYGLDGCLSTRIRHGALENIIRGTFERYSIISKKTDNKYQKVELWLNNGIHLSDVTNDEIQNHLIDFTSEVDNLIKFLLNEKIQIYSIKYTEKKQALFNYNFQDEYHWFIFNDLKNSSYNYEDFLNYFFDVLKSHTNKILLDSKKYFKVTVRDKLINLLEDLNRKINDSLKNNSYPKLLNNIKTAITQIQNEIHDNISEWFKLSEDTFQNLLSFSSIINTSIYLTSLNEVTFKPKVDCENDISVYGYLHYIFIFRILFDNIIKHSNLSISETDAIVKANHDEINNVMRISVKNKIGRTINKDDLKYKIQNVKDNWSTKSPIQEIINKEGGSGFEKIKRILTYDLRSKKHSFDFELTDNNIEIFITIPMKILT